jgi:hypothetical protein
MLWLTLANPLPGTRREKHTKRKQGTIVIVSLLVEVCTVQMLKGGGGEYSKFQCQPKNVLFIIIFAPWAEYTVRGRAIMSE